MDQKHFLPLLEFRVELELGYKPRIFLDETGVESGVSWAHHLGAVLGSSKILIPLWTRTFFSSEWCAQELGHMLAREEETGFRSAKNPRGLIVPAVIHDGETFPEEVRGIQYFELQQCYITRMAVDSLLAEKLENILAEEAPAIAHAIENAPPWKDNWSQEAAERFYSLLKSHAPAQTTLPRFTK